MAYKKAPLYLFSNDTKPGDTEAAMGGIKHGMQLVLEPPRRRCPLGSLSLRRMVAIFLADAKGMTIYA